MDMETVRAAIEPDEPNYAEAAARLGPDALPFLHEIIQGDDPMLASKAVYLASLISSRDATSIVMEAAAHADPIVRVAAASAAANLVPEEGTKVLMELASDSDQGVRKVVQAAAAAIPSEELDNALRQPTSTPAVEEVLHTGLPPITVGGRMPGEPAPESFETQPRGGVMPGERAENMPSGTGSGKMPGEA